MATGLGLKNVIFLGFLKTGPLRTMLRHSFAGLITIRNNRQSVQNKPAEYMAFGLPLISSLEGEFAQLVDQEPLGVSYRATDVESLTRAIRQLLDTPTFTEACRQRVRQLFAERFSAQAIYPAYVDDLEQICMPATAERELGR
jgi:glycosyltransferase involved in cell wall biosynthesis